MGAPSVARLADSTATSILFRYLGMDGIRRQGACPWLATKQKAERIGGAGNLETKPSVLRDEYSYCCLARGRFVLIPASPVHGWAGSQLPCPVLRVPQPQSIPQPVHASHASGLNMETPEFMEEAAATVRLRPREGTGSMELALPQVRRWQQFAHLPL